MVQRNYFDNSTENLGLNRCLNTLLEAVQIKLDSEHLFGCGVVVLLSLISVKCISLSSV